MRIRLLRPPPITVRLDRDYRIEPVWMAGSDSGSHFGLRVGYGPDTWQFRRVRAWHLAIPQ